MIANGVSVDTIGQDSVFGEVALIYDLPRTASIRAKSDCKMWLLHRSSFQHILRDKAITERKEKFSFLKTVKIFASLSTRQVMGPHTPRRRRRSPPTTNPTASPPRPGS